jgi:hypothetical protein
LAELAEMARISSNLARFSPSFAHGVKYSESAPRLTGETTKGRCKNRDEDSRSIQRLPDPASTVIV